MQNEDTKMKVKISRFCMVVGSWMIFIALISHFFAEQCPLPTLQAIMVVIGSILLWTFALFDLEEEWF